MSSRQTPSWRTARAGLALATVLGGGALAPLAGASSASAAGPAAGGAPRNGPIAFTGATASGTGWVEVNPDGSDHGGRHEVTPSGAGIDPKAKDTHITFSPDGSRVLFVQHGDGSLWAAAADGSGAHRLTTLAPGQAAENPAWSADGATVYFSLSTTVDAQMSWQLMQVPAGGGTATAVPGIPASDTAGFVLTVSPDGSKMAYSYFNPDSSVHTMEVAVVDAKTHAVISTLPGATDPQYSPDGEMLGVQEVVNGKWAIVAYPPDGLASPGSQGRQLAQTLGAVGFAFSPDGTEVAYDSQDADGRLQMVIQPVSGGSPAVDQLNEAIADEMLSWRNGPLYTGPVTPAPSSTPPRDRPTVDRLGGTDRIDTSVITADAAYAPQNGVTTAQVAVLSRADSFADALAGDPLAAAKKGPLLLTGSGRLDPRVAAELTRTLAPHSVVYILGGTGALGPQVDKDVAALGFTPRRIAGGDRFDTAVRVAREISPRPASVLVATGLNFPDALTAGAAAAGNGAGGVVVLTDGTSVPAETKAYLASLDRSKSTVYGVGGQAVTALKKTLGAADPFVGLYGADRYGTAATVLNCLFAYSGHVSGTPGGVVGLATGHDWPDALSGGAHIGTYGGPLLLADGANIPAAESDWLHGHSAFFNTIDVFGGTKVVPQGALTQAANTSWGAGNWSQAHR